MKRKITLEEAKSKLGNEKIFLGKNNSLTVADFGKYRPGVTFVVPDQWTLDDNKIIESPIRWHSVPELTDNMNIDFDSSNVEVVFGEHWTSKGGNPVFKITEPTKAKQVLICAGWGGAFDSSRGHSKNYANEIGADYFRRASSNGGGCGYDYYILPVDFVAFSNENRDVSEILKKVEQMEDDRVRKNEETILYKEEETKKSIANKAEYEPKILELVNQINETVKDYRPKQITATFGDDSVSVSYWYKSFRYSDEIINNLENRLNELKSSVNKKEEYLGKFEEQKELIQALGCELDTSSLDSVTLKTPYNGSGVQFSYNEEGVSNCFETLKNTHDRQKKETEKRKEETARILAEAKKEADEKAAKEEGYPSDFTFRHREGGKTAQACAYVIRPDGTLRLNDRNDLDNRNHVYKYSDPIHNADGLQHWDQILPGELVIAFTKEYTAAPVVCTLEWAPTEITPAQIDAASEIAEKLNERYYGPDNGMQVEGWDDLIRHAIPSKLTPPGFDEQDITENNSHNEI